MTSALKAAAPPVRRSILRALSGRELDLASLGERATLSREELVPHVEALRRAGLLQVELRGDRTFCRLDARRTGEIAGFLQLVSRSV
jgi:DNA-binding transcriptional ArsR family regulator